LEVAAAAAADTAVRAPASVGVGMADRSAEAEAEGAATATVRGQGVPAISPQRFAVARQDLDAGGSTDAGVPTDAGGPAGVDSAGWAGQVNCVIRLGGCPNTRPGGIPTTQEITQYNADCRRETSYVGPDVVPSDEQCRNPPPPESEALLFARTLATRYPGWLDVLPDCPCTDAEAKGSSDWSGPNACLPDFHPGAATGYRSVRGYASVPGTNHGQQCCYDVDGRLITDGQAAGTPDVVQAPSGLGAALGGIFGEGPGPLAAADHYLVDVVPFETLGWAVYNQYWVPNKGRGCPPNRKP
jgi:hypothetical protein